MSLFRLLLVLSSCAMLGCMPNSYMRSEHDFASVQHAIAEVPQLLQAPPVVCEKGYYVDPRPVSDQGPKWLDLPVRVTASAMPLDQLMTQLLRRHHLVQHYQPGLDAKRWVHLRYTGTMRGALDELAAQTQYHYEASSGALRWERFQTRTFNIAFMPGTSDYLIGQSAGHAHDATHNASHDGPVVATQGHLYDAQYSNLQASLSVWRDLKTVLGQLKSKEGQVTVSEATTTVTVRDTPDRVAAMGRYIKELNHHLSQQVNVKIRVLNVELNDLSNYGINWDMVQRFAGSKLRIVGALADATNLATTRVASDASSAGLTTFSIGSTPKAVIHALSEQGKVSVVTEPEVTTMNNQIAEVLITRDTGYLQSVSSTTLADQGTTTSLTPGVVTDGFSLYLLPKIQNEDVYLQISSTLSTLTQLVQISNAASGGSSSIVQSIQVPTLSEKHFNQRTRIPSGQTLVITGFKQTHHHSKKAGPFGVTPVGSVGGERKNVQTLVLLTPTIVEPAQR